VAASFFFTVPAILCVKNVVNEVRPKGDAQSTRQVQSIRRIMNGRLCSTVGLLTLVVGAEAFVSSSVSTTTPSRCDVRTPNVRSFAPPALHVWKDAREPEHNIIQSNITLDNDLTLEFNLHSSIAAIPPEAWNACLPNKDRIGLGSAFLDYSWLHCLEESKCASPQTGWVPQHVSIKLNGETKGFIPVYIKEHSSKY